MARGTRKEIIAEIMNWSATWGSPLSREQAEAKADQTIKAMRKATRPHWGWFILFMIVAVLWVWFIASAIALLAN
jgi:t-SNARE complex subunit (syntaxin)